MPSLDRVFAHSSLMVRGLGHVLLMLGLGYCLFMIVDMGTDATLASLTPRAWFATVIVGLAYGVSLSILALSWAAMASCNARVGLHQALVVYGPGVVAKYLPGSIFQYGSRQAIGAQYGFAQMDMARASLKEALLHVACVLLVAFCLLVAQSSLAVVGLAVCGVVCTIVGGASLVGFFGRQLVFFCIFALLVAGLASVAIGIGEPLHATGLFMLAWLVGFLVPLAPGGIGVRESALLVLSQPHDWGAQVAALALLTRVATGLGDVLFGGVGYFLMTSGRAKTQAS